MFGEGSEECEAEERRGHTHARNPTGLEPEIHVGKGYYEADAQTDEDSAEGEVLALGGMVGDVLSGFNSSNLLLLEAGGCLVFCEEDLGVDVAIRRRASVGSHVVEDGLVFVRWLDGCTDKKSIYSHLTNTVQYG